MAQRAFQAVFGAILLVMFLMTLFGWTPPASFLSEAGQRWSEVNLRPDMIVALLLIYGIGAGSLLSNRFVALGAAVQAPLAVNIAMYHLFVNQVLVPGGLMAAAYFVGVAVLLWFNRASYASLFEARPHA